MGMRADGSEFEAGVVLPLGGAVEAATNELQVRPVWLHRFKALYVVEVSSFIESVVS